jgi:hypothetical protein
MALTKIYPLLIFNINLEINFMIDIKNNHEISKISSVVAGNPKSNNAIPIIPFKSRQSSS